MFGSSKLATETKPTLRKEVNREHINFTSCRSGCFAPLSISGVPQSIEFPTHTPKNHYISP
jgi:hypothetical protein